jgi:hypothetical protein
MSKRGRPKWSDKLRVGNKEFTHEQIEYLAELLRGSRQEQLPAESLQERLHLTQKGVQARRRSVARTLGLTPGNREQIAHWALPYREEILAAQSDTLAEALGAWPLPVKKHAIDARISSPPITENERGLKTLAQLRDWVTSDEMVHLLSHWKITLPANDHRFFRNLASATEDWNLRRDLLERWIQAREAHKDIVIDSAARLGVREATSPLHTSYELAIALGGARMAPKLRMLYLEKMVSEWRIQFRAVAHATSFRPIDEDNERQYTAYAPPEQAQTEFDLMHHAAMAAPHLYGDASRFLDVEKSPEGRPWAESYLVRKYEGRSGGPLAYGLAADSSAPKAHRPRTPDTLKFVYDKIGRECELKPGSRILLVTSMIYVPYQQIEALRVLALPHELDVETVGFPRTWSSKSQISDQVQNLHEAGNYLQEIRSALQACARLEKYQEGN